VGAFLMGEPWLLPCGGYGSVAAKADGVTGSVFVVPVLKVEAVGGWLERGVGHKVAAFEATDFDAINNSTLRLPIRLRNPCVDGTGAFVPDGERCAHFVSRRAAPRAFLVPKQWEAELMVLTQGWVNGVAIGIVAVAVARLWKWPSWWKRYRASRKRGDVG
jgi:hypothetical protein